ncbi:sugar kinase [Aurantiacibacter zhengii]
MVTAPRIICLGEGMVEERVAPDGTLTAHYGGDTLNTAIHLARLGCNVAYATALGCDEESDKLVAAWQAEGIDTSLIGRHPDRGVGRYRIAVDSAGERSFSYDRLRSAARDMFALDASDGWTDAVGEANCFVYSLISLAILPEIGREQVLDLAEKARRTAYDGNFRPALWESADATLHWHERAIGSADIGLPTVEDEVALRGEGWAGAEADVAACWRGLGCGEVLVKAGAAGCLLPDGTPLAPPEPLSPVDTSGAGDAFNAGYIAARLRGREPGDAALAAHRLAGWNIMRAGAIPAADDAAPYRNMRGHDREQAQ